MTPRREYALAKQSEKADQGPPKILTGLIRDPAGKVTGFHCIDFIPGAIIERRGRKYQVQKDGSQRRLRVI